MSKLSQFNGPKAISSDIGPHVLTSLRRAATSHYGGTHIAITDLECQDEAFGGVISLHLWINKVDFLENVKVFMAWDKLKVVAYKQVFFHHISPLLLTPLVLAGIVGSCKWVLQYSSAMHCSVSSNRLDTDAMLTLRTRSQCRSLTEYLLRTILMTASLSCFRMTSGCLPMRQVSMSWTWCASPNSAVDIEISSHCEVLLAMLGCFLLCP